MEAFDLEQYLNSGVEQIVAGILRASAKNPKQSRFLLRYLADSRRAAKLRRNCEAKGEHIPPFLIASISAACNLHCRGCYAWANHICGEADAGLLTGGEWGAVFDEAAALGIGFILLAGGEPFLRPDVLEEAAKRRKLLFPIFTNGTLLDGGALDLLDRSRNLIPVLSIEGGEGATDARRGAGVYRTLLHTMEQLNARGILFAASVTVTADNLDEVLSEGFVEALAEQGCKGIVYVEYVPADPSAGALALDDARRARMLAQLDVLREAEEELLLIAFPGDELGSGGCLAAGRGFFHINARGGAEPCPFSPYSDVDVRKTGLRGALRSPLFRKLRESGALEQDHAGGCVLFAQADTVQRLLEGQTV